jgi:hypothetical protein
MRQPARAVYTMNSLAAECRELNAAGVIDAAVASRAVALESGSLFTLFEELRLAFYIAVAAIASGIGLVLKNNLDRIGAAALIVALALVAAGCYAGAIRTRLRAEERGIAGDYILLLGALIVSADLGYAESQYHWLGTHWSAHLLILAVFHALTAYALDSRLVLSVSLTSLAAWFGVETRFAELLRQENTLRNSGVQALACACVIFVWRELHRRLDGDRPFAKVFEHFAANLGFWGALALCFSADTRLVGLAFLIVLTVVAIRTGLRRSEEMFIIYGIAYCALGLCYLEGALIEETLLATILQLATVLVALALLWRFRQKARAAL